MDNKNLIDILKVWIENGYNDMAYSDKSLYTENPHKELNIEYFVKNENNTLFYHLIESVIEESNAKMGEKKNVQNKSEGLTILFFDIETTGLPLLRNKSFNDLKNWPYIVQIAYILCDESFNIKEKQNLIIKPEGYKIPMSSSSIHGISNEFALDNGIVRTEAFNHMNEILSKTDILIGHNVEFDINTLKCELFRVLGFDKSLSVYKRHSIIDTMKIGTDLCKIPYYKYGFANFKNFTEKIEYKWPTLEELYNFLFNKELLGKHNAMNDILATYECCVEMNKMGLVKLYKNDGWEITGTRVFTDEEKRRVSKAFVVSNEYGKFICFIMKDGQQGFIKLSPDVDLAEGMEIEIEKMKIQTLSKLGHADINEIII